MTDDGWSSCAARSRELDEPLGGTAVRALGWVCVEHRGPWSPAAPSVAELGDAAAALAAPDVRVQLIRRPLRAHDPDDGVATGPLTVLLAHGAVDPAARWLRRLEVDDPIDLLTTVHPSVTTTATPPGVGEAVDHDVWLVCAHGRRDGCCALHGRPVAAALRDAGVEVWETTHTGGHRFAATALLLPDGLSLGRLDTVPATTLVADLAAGTVDPALVRGRCAVPHPVQAAEAHARIRLGLTPREGLLPRRWSTTGDTTTVQLDEDERSWTATVRSGPASPPRPISDGAEPTVPDQHVLSSLRPV